MALATLRGEPDFSDEPKITRRLLFELPAALPLFGAAALLIAITLADHAVAQNKGRDYFGVGGQSRGTWTAARKSNNASCEGSRLLGYLSALNALVVIGQTDALPVT